MNSEDESLDDVAPTRALSLGCSEDSRHSTLILDDQESLNQSDSVEPFSSGPYLSSPVEPLRRHSSGPNLSDPVEPIKRNSSGPSTVSIL